MDKLVSIFESECRDNSDMTTAGNDVQYRFRNGILTFQQSVSEQDWITNFSILPKKYNELVGHGGYIKSYQSVKDLVIGLNPRLIVGFSYGGPLAGLLHRDLKYFNSCSMDVPTIVFGCPKFVIYDGVNDWSGVTLRMSIIEYFDDNIITPQSVNRNGQIAAEWISASVTLQADTRYISIAFIRDDGISSFTADELLILPTCFSIT